MNKWCIQPPPFHILYKNKNTFYIFYGVKFYYDTPSISNMAIDLGAQFL